MKSILQNENSDSGKSITSSKLLFSKIFILALLLLTSKLNAQNVYIPDVNFRGYLTANYPTCMLGDSLDTSCSGVVYAGSININYVGITDLTGISHFVNLQTLYCTNNQLSNLPPLPASLQMLYCGHNQLSSLPALPGALQLLDCRYNQLSSLPSLPASLLTLECYFNQLSSLPSLPVSLNALLCNDNQLSNLPVLPASLQTLDCQNNQISSLPALPVSLEGLFCSGNQISSLPALPISLIHLGCTNNLLTVLPSLPASLQYLYCQSNQLSSLPALPESLLWLQCYSNWLSSLPSLPASLQKLQCFDNQLSCLPYLPNLTELSANAGNSLSCIPNVPSTLTINDCSGLPICDVASGCPAFAQNPNEVWPGDANNDLVTNNFDLLSVGLAYGETGTVRSGASETWVGQLASDWADSAFVNINNKHIDCNGDGVINDEDTTAILLNYSLTHSKTEAENNAASIDPVLGLEFVGSSASVSDTVQAIIKLGTVSVQADNVYGLAFTINYDPSLVDSGSVHVEFGSSWLGSTGTTMLTLQKDFYSNGKIDVALTRINHTALSGNGEIGRVTFVMIDDLSGKQLISEIFNVSVSNVRIIDNNGAELSVNTNGDSVVVYQNTTGVRTTANKAVALKVYPNPAKDIVNINAGTPIESVELKNIIGQTVYQSALSGILSRIAIDTRSYPAGVYFLNVQTATGIISQKVYLSGN